MILNHASLSRRPLEKIWSRSPWPISSFSKTGRNGLILMWSRSGKDNAHLWAKYTDSMVVIATLNFPARQDCPANLCPLCKCLCEPSLPSASPREYKSRSWERIKTLGNCPREPNRIGVVSYVRTLRCYIHIPGNNGSVEPPARLPPLCAAL